MSDISVCIVLHVCKNRKNMEWKIAQPVNVSYLGGMGSKELRNTWFSKNSVSLYHVKYNRNMFFKEVKLSFKINKKKTGWTLLWIELCHLQVNMLKP